MSSQTEAAMSQLTSDARMQATDPFHAFDDTIDEIDILKADFAQRPQRVGQLARPHAAARHVVAQQVEQPLVVWIRL